MLSTTTTTAAQNNTITTSTAADADHKLADKAANADSQWSDSGICITTDSGLSISGHDLQFESKEFTDDGELSLSGLRITDSGHDLTVTNSGRSAKWVREAFTPNQDGDTYLHLAIIHGLQEVCYQLIRSAPHPDFLDITNHLQQTPLHLAALTGESLVVRRLVIAGATLDLRDRKGNTALHMACRQSDYITVCQLISPIHQQEIDAHYVVNYTVNTRPLPVQFLELPNYEGETCLQLSAKNKNITQLLVESGADVNAQY